MRDSPDGKSRADLAWYSTMSNLNPSPSSSLQDSPSSPSSHEEISRRARELWESRGQPSGQDEAIWLEAEREVRNGSNPPQAPEIQRAAPSNAPSPQPAGRSRSSAASSRSTSRGQRRDAEGVQDKASVSAGRNAREQDADPDI
jgi:hypothetical protein